MRRPRLPRLLASAVVLATLLLVAGCATDGRDLRSTQPWQTTTTRPVPATIAPEAEAGRSGLALTSPDFQPGGPVPAAATCAGGSIVPALRWSSVPLEAVELVVTISDQTDPAAPVLLWLLAGIEPDLPGLDAGAIPIGAFETLNGFGNPGFGIPCLETMAEGSRDLQFRLYALPQPSGVAPGAPGDEAWTLVRAGATDSASLLARFDPDAGGDPGG
ncbi:MAG: YbhB/YbcL family Raf kinase inhibitor-like protein [Actinomycetota bacterium]